VKFFIIFYFIFLINEFSRKIKRNDELDRRISGAIALRWVDSSLSCRPSNGKPTGVSPSRRGGKKVRGRGRVCAKRARSFSTEFACKQSSLQRKTMLNDRENVFPPLSSIVLATREFIFHCGHQNQLKSARIMHINEPIRSNLIAQQREREQDSNYFRKNY